MQLSVSSFQLFANPDIISPVDDCLPPALFAHLSQYLLLPFSRVSRGVLVLVTSTSWQPTKNKTPLHILCRFIKSSEWAGTRRRLRGGWGGWHETRYHFVAHCLFMLLNNCRLRLLELHSLIANRSAGIVIGKVSWLFTCVWVVGPFCS